MTNTNDFVMNKETYETVTNAIVKQAAQDYMRYKKRRYKLDTYIYKYRGKRRLKLMLECDRMIADVLNFFKSDWYSMICNVDSKYLLDKLNAVYEEELVDVILKSV